MQISNKDDIDSLISICKGNTRTDSPSCGFGSAELVFEGNGHKISIYPACDGCDLMRVNNSNSYISIGLKSRKKLDEILQKYGATFPCI